MKYLIALILALLAPAAFGAVGTSPGNSGIGGSGVVNVQSNSTTIGSVTNINFILGAGLTTSVITNHAASNAVNIALIVSGGAATNAISLLNGNGTNTTFSHLTIGTGAFTNSVTSTHTGSSTFSGNVTNSGIVRITGGLTETGGTTNTGHLRMTGWLEASGNLTNTALAIFSGSTTFSGGVTNSGIVRTTGGVTQTAGVTNSAHLRMTGWTETSAGLTNMGNVATLQSAPLLISGSFNLQPITNASLAISQITNAYALYVTNADLTFTFAGTAVNGARGQVDIVNTAMTNITVTWPISFSVANGSAVTSFTAASNSITEVFWSQVGGSNRVRVASKEIIENFTSPTAGQVVGFHDAYTKTNLTAGAGDVTAASSFGTDNVLIRANGTGKGVQGSGVTLDDSENIGTPGGLRGASAVVTNTLTIPFGSDPDVSGFGQLSMDTNGFTLRAYNGSAQQAIARTIEAIHCTVVLPNDLADSERDAFWVWSNESGMSFIVTGWKAWSDTDDTTLNIEEIDADGQNNATVDAVEIATNGTGLFSGSDTTITAATIENGHLLVLDFDDTDTPGQVKITIYGYYAADVN